MVKILVVDDEKLERQGIRFLLGQLGMDAEMDEEVNGVKALEYLEKNTVDILLTDVKMPFMDGLTLIEHVSKLYPKIKIVIFSGYGEFEYARKAMLYHVNHYILKPVDPNEFQKTMETVLREIEEEKIEEELQEESIQFFKEHILWLIMNGNNVEDHILKAGKLVDPDFYKKYRLMMLLEFDKEFFGRRDDDFAGTLMQECDVDFQYLNLNSEQCVLLFGGENAIDREKLAEKILSVVKEKYGEKCYISVSEYKEDYIVLQKCYETLEQLMENKFYLTDSCIFYEENEPIAEVEKAMEDDLIMKQIKQDIKMKDMVALREHFDTLCEKYHGTKVFSQMYIKFIFSSLMKDMFDMLPESEKGGLSEAVDKLYRANDFSEVMDILRGGIEKLEKTFSVNPQMMHREIETVKEYIYANYDKELSVDMLADQVFMAPSYLSHVFKKETGQNLSKFIKALRMEKAKEMLTDTHMKIIDISYGVGYPNVSYFCQSFREYFGVSPQKFRSQGESR